MAFGKLSLAGAIISAIAVMLMLAGLFYNVLFEVEVKEPGTNVIETVKCRWDRRTFTDGTADQMYSDADTESEEELAGQLWLCFGFISCMCGVAGTIFSLLHIKTEFLFNFVEELNTGGQRTGGTFMLKPLACGFLLFAGIAAMCAWGGAFNGWDDNTCAKNENSAVKYSLPLAFTAMFIYWIGMACILCDRTHAQLDRADNQEKAKQQRIKKYEADGKYRRSSRRSRRSSSIR